MLNDLDQLKKELHETRALCEKLLSDVVALRSEVFTLRQLVAEKNDCDKPIIAVKNAGELDTKLIARLLVLWPDMKFTAKAVYRRLETDQELACIFTELTGTKTTSAIMIGRALTKMIGSEAEINGRKATLSKRSMPGQIAKYCVTVSSMGAATPGGDIDPAF